MGINKLVELAARLLEPDERNAVLGDLAEASENGFRALTSVLGLVARRQTALWGDWRPWLALVGLVGLVAPRLFRMSMDVGDPLYMDIRTYLKYGSLYASGMTSGEVVFASLCGVAGLVFWSWTSGFVLGSLSRRTIWTTGTLYYFHLWLFPLSLIWVTWKFGRTHSWELAMFAVATAVQIGMYLALFVAPSFLGLKQGLKKLTVSRPRAYLIAGISVVLTVLAVWTGGWQQAAVTRWGGGAWDASVGWPGRLLFFGVLSWPAAYLAMQRAQFTFWLGNGGHKRWKS